MVTEQPSSHPSPRRGRVWKWIVFSVVVAVAVLLMVGNVMVHRAGPILKGRVIDTLSTRFNSRVELDSLDVSLVKGLEVSGKGLRIYAPDDVVAAGATAPMISLEHFRFHAPLRGLFVKPTHVGTVYVSGMEIHIPPREARAAAPQTGKKKKGKIEVLVDQIEVENSHLYIDTFKPNKDPKHFELQHIRMRDVGPSLPWKYDAVLVNAIPRGDIHATGDFGPWNNEEPGDSLVTGKYTFDNADLGSIKGIGGMLSSVGTFHGQLDRIEADGTTHTPDFSLDTAHYPMNLDTTFHAIVDGTSGDTYLQPVHAKLGSSEFTCAGAVVNVKGKGHITDLDVNIPNGHLSDFLMLAVKTKPAIMQAGVGMKMHLRIPYGKESVTQKLEMDGGFTLHNIHFTNAKVQDKVDMLSLRAQGNPQDAKPGAPDVSSNMQGKLTSRNGHLNFPMLHYALPGGQIALQGTYSMDGKQFNFFGKVRTEAKISEMIASKWKSFLLKPIDPFFHHNGAGAEIPVKITGTEDEPHFGLDLHHKTPEEEKKQKSKTRADSGVVM